MVLWEEKNKANSTEPHMHWCSMKVHSFLFSEAQVIRDFTNRAGHKPSRNYYLGFSLMVPGMHRLILEQLDTLINRHVIFSSLQNAIPHFAI